MALEDLTIPNALLCPYYWGQGTCPFGCWSEPSCQTDEPLNGWRIRDRHGRFLTQREETDAMDHVRQMVTKEDA